MISALGIDIGGTNTKIAHLVADGEIAESVSMLTRHERGADAFLDRLERTVPVPWREADVLGIAVAGLVEGRRVIVQAPNLSTFEGIDFAAAVGDRWNKPAVLDNDVNAALWGEFRAGAARGCRNVVMLSLGTGVGGGLLLEGRLYRGASGTAAELGHTFLDPEGEPCPCGERGHVESYLSTAAFVATARRALEEDPQGGSRLREQMERDGELSPRVLARAAEAGDELAARVLADRGWWLGMACANAVNAFNPERIVVGGGVAGCGEFLLATTRATMRERSMPRPGEVAELRTAELGPAGAAVGAAYLGLDSLDDEGSGVHA